MILSYMLQRTLIQISLASFDECTLHNPCQGEKSGISARLTDMSHMHRFHMVDIREHWLVEMTVLRKPENLRKYKTSHMHAVPAHKNKHTGMHTQHTLASY